MPAHGERGEGCYHRYRNGGAATVLKACHSGRRRVPAPLDGCGRSRVTSSRRLSVRSSISVSHSATVDCQLRSHLPTNQADERAECHPFIKASSIRRTEHLIALGLAATPLTSLTGLTVPRLHQLTVSHRLSIIASVFELHQHLIPSSVSVSVSVCRLIR